MEQTDMAWEAGAEKMLDQQAAFTFQMYPQILDCIRQGDVVELLRQERLIDHDAYFKEALAGAIDYRPAFLFTTGITLYAAWQGGLPLSKGTALCTRYQQISKQLRTVSDFVDCSFRMRLDFTKAVREYGVAQNESATVRRCRAYVYEHVYERIRLNDLAGVCGYSCSRLQHVFCAETGMTLTAYIRAQKINKAKFLLTHTHDACGRISQKLSFCSQSYFVKQFKKETGMTPARYRRQAAGLNSNQ